MPMIPYPWKRIQDIYDEDQTNVCACAWLDVDRLFDLSDLTSNRLTTGLGGLSRWASNYGLSFWKVNALLMRFYGHDNQIISEVWLSSGPNRFRAVLASTRWSSPRLTRRCRVQFSIGSWVDTGGLNLPTQGVYFGKLT